MSSNMVMVNVPGIGKISVPEQHLDKVSSLIKEKPADPALVILAEMMGQFKNGIDELSADNNKRMDSMLNALNSFEIKIPDIKIPKADAVKFPKIPAPNVTLSPTPVKVAAPIVNIENKANPAAKVVHVTDVIYGGKQDRAIGCTITVTEREQV